jgi:glycosyltransferase involved in cell wall biosynthesis
MIEAQMVTVHFCIESYDVRRGGMEESALRLINALASQPRLRLIAYVLSVPVADDMEPPDIQVVDIAVRILPLIEPLGPLTLFNRRERGAEQSRLQVLLLRQAMSDRLQTSGNCRHVILSYYLSTAGFVAQHVASEFGIPHIACARGSDLGRDVFTRESLAAPAFVLQRATCIVTTSKEHARFVRYLTHREQDVHTIYNGLSSNIRPTWTRFRSDRVRLVSLCGYSVKKGTNTLLKAVARLLDLGLPVELTIAGRTGIGEWNAIRQQYLGRYGERISFRDVIARQDVDSFLLSGDIFCSASISEGCANATMRALGLGLPIVSTATGALVDFQAGLDHVATVEPGNEDSFVEALRRCVDKVLSGTLTINIAQVEAVIERLSAEREANAWITLFEKYCGRPSGGTLDQSTL